MDCQFIYILTITNIELLWIVYSLTNEQQKAYNFLYIITDSRVFYDDLGKSNRFDLPTI
jgi:hypothetical protein